MWQDQPRQKKTEVASLTNETKNRVKNTRWQSHRVFFTRFFVEFGGKPPKFFAKVDPATRGEYKHVRSGHSKALSKSFYRVTHRVKTSH